MGYLAGFLACRALVRVGKTLVPELAVAAAICRVCNDLTSPAENMLREKAELGAVASGCRVLSVSLSVVWPVRAVFGVLVRGTCCTGEDGGWESEVDTELKCLDRVRPSRTDTAPLFPGLCLLGVNLISR